MADPHERDTGEPVLRTAAHQDKIVQGLVQTIIDFLRTE